MELHGSTEANLIAAVRSARRLRGHPVHPDTLEHWRDLLHHARRALSAEPFPGTDSMKQLVVDLESELAERTTQA
ncbi:MAG TPA: hypothetical protein VGW38_09020 [Chloroflexota bacterium]|nr:hypothetical protein [Chloroflexota bacterium]